MRSYRNSETPPPIMAGFPPSGDMRLPLLDWDRPPWNRWAFQRIREILPTATIRRSEVASPLPAATGGLGDFTYRRSDGTEMTFARMLDETYTDAIWVWKDGKVLHESYHNGMGPRTLHLLQSVSKSITATAGATLIEAGLIDPAAPVTDYLPELVATAWKGATVRQVLDMTTGVRFVEEYDVRDSDIGKMDYASGWKPAPPGTDISDWPGCVWDQILQMTRKEAEHGARFSYRSIETDVFAHVMQRAAGKRLPELISERLWQPLGCEEDADITIDRAGYALADGGICAALRDMGRFALAYLQDGKVGGRQVIPRAWVEDVRHGRHGVFATPARPEFPKGAYRNQFWIEDGELGRHYGMGIFGQLVAVLPDAGIAAVKFSTWPDATDSGHLTQVIDALQALARE